MLGYEVITSEDAGLAGLLVLPGLIREIRRPHDRATIIRLVGAVLAEQNDEWR